MYRSRKSLKPADLDLNAQGQIGLEPSKILVINLIVQHFTFKLFTDHLNILEDFEIGDLNFIFKIKLALKLSNFFCFNF